MVMEGLAADLFSHCIHAREHTDEFSASLMLRKLTPEGLSQLRDAAKRQCRLGASRPTDEFTRANGEFVRLPFYNGEKLEKFYNARVVAVLRDEAGKPTRFRIIYEDGDAEELGTSEYIEAATRFKEARASGILPPDMEEGILSVRALYRAREAWLADTPGSSAPAAAATGQLALPAPRGALTTIKELRFVRGAGQSQRVLVAWRGFPGEDTWEPAAGFAAADIADVPVLPPEEVCCALCDLPDARHPQHGTMLLCDAPECESGWHLRCADPQRRRVPLGPWLCPDCADT